MSEKLLSQALSNGEVVGEFPNGEYITWPSSMGFVHISEQNDQLGNPVAAYNRVSGALKLQFLPFRACALDGLLELTADALSNSVGDSAEAARSERVKALQESIAQKMKSGNHEIDSREIELEAQQLRLLLQQEPGAFVRHRRSH